MRAPSTLCVSWSMRTPFTAVYVLICVHTEISLFTTGIEVYVLKDDLRSTLRSSRTLTLITYVARGLNLQLCFEVAVGPLGVQRLQIRRRNDKDATAASKAVIRSSSLVKSRSVRLL